MSSKSQNNSQKKASIIIPTWNGKELLKVCLKSLEEQTTKDFEVIIIDNGSIDGTETFVEKEYSDFKLIHLEKNVGFSPAVNIGIKEAGGEYVILLNNDTRVDKDCIKQLIKTADEKKDISMIAAKMLQYNNSDVIDSAGDYIDVVGHADNIGRDQKDSEEYNQPKELFLVTGGGSLFKKELFDKIGLFDEDYFAYMEDVDLCLRAQFVGFKGWFEPKAVIYHIHKATSSKNQAFLEYLQFRNMMQTIIKDFSKDLLLKDFNWLRIILVNINTVRFLATKGYLGAALKAEWYILIHLPRLLNKRSKIQKSISVDSTYLLENFKPKKLRMPFINIRI